MLFGLQSPAQIAAANAAAHSRLQQRMEDDPRVTSMQPGGVTVLPEQPFVFGEGGERLTPDQVADRRRMGQQQMAAGMDTSPVGHWTQGAARVAQALVGAMSERKAEAAERANAQEGMTVVQALMNPPNGADAGYDAKLLGALANPYLDPSLRSVAASERERRLKANAPEYFMSGRDRVRFDPSTGQSAVVFDGREDFETYAASMGFQPGTPEYNTAAQDFVLRSHGPTALANNVDLEGVRQENRVGLENVRQGNRLGLRQTPTYRDTHPRPSAGGGNGSGPRSSRPPTMAGTMAPILAKVASGKALTPAEQQAWNMYRPPSRAGGRQPTVASALVQKPKNGAPADLPRPSSRAEFAKLPKGARFIDPQGAVRVK